MKKNLLVFTDLDHTLFQAMAPTGEHLYPMTVNESGKIRGYATQAQYDMLNALFAAGVVIPLTARSHVKFERVINWNTGRSFDFALTDLGATLLWRDWNDTNWQVVPEWHEPYENLAIERSATLIEDRARIIKRGEESNFSFEVNILELGKLGIPFYLEIKVENNSAEFDVCEAFFHAVLETLLEDRGFYRLYRHKNVWCLWPNYVSKKIALKRFMAMAEKGFVDERINNAIDGLNILGSTIITAGDHATDLGFMREGAFMLMPTNSALASSLG